LHQIDKNTWIDCVKKHANIDLIAGCLSNKLTNML